MADNHPQPHDKFFKEVFSTPQQAAGLIKGFLDGSISAYLDLNSLHREPESFIGDTFHERFADLVFKCRLKGSSSEVRISLLLEHKSYVPKNIYFQLLQYMLDIWKRLEESGEKFTPVIPIVVYHGKRGWTPKPMAESLLEPYPDFLLNFLPRFMFSIINLRYLELEEIQNRAPDPILRQSLIVFKYALTDELKTVLLDILNPSGFESGNEQHVQFIRTLVNYLTHGTTLDIGTIMETANHSMKEWGYIPGSAADILIRKGKAEEREIAVSVIKSFNKGMEASEIAKKLQAPLEDVQAIIEKYLSED